MMKRISQQKARAAIKRVAGTLMAAQRLKHPLVAVVEEDKLHLYALPA